MANNSQAHDAPRWLALVIEPFCRRHRIFLSLSVLSFHTVVVVVSRAMHTYQTKCRAQLKSKKPWCWWWWIQQKQPHHISSTPFLPGEQLANDVLRTIGIAIFFWCASVSAFRFLSSPHLVVCVCVCFGGWFSSDQRRLSATHKIVTNVNRTPKHQNQQK